MHLRASIRCPPHTPLLLPVLPLLFSSPAVVAAVVQTYYFNVCGTSPERCYPKDHHVRYSYGAAVQTWGSPPPCNTSDPSASYFDPTLNRTMCYTTECEVLGVGTPIWELADPGDPFKGGVLLRHEGVPPSIDDNNRCPINPATGAEWERAVTFHLQCDQSLPENELVLQRVYENETCRYVVELATVSACACLPNCYGKNCGPDGCGGYCSGASLGGNCPYGQVCQADQTCCRPDCTNRDCGDDGCGGTCGTCGSDETCSPQQVCFSSTPFIPTAAATYAPDHGGLAGAFFGGVFFCVVISTALWFVKCGGKARFDRWRFGGDDQGGLLAGGGSSGGRGAGASTGLYSSGKDSAGTSAPIAKGISSYGT